MGMKLPPDVEAKVLAAALPSARRPHTTPGPLTAVVTVPGVAIVPEANRRDHWAVRRRRAKAQQAATLAALVCLGPDVRDRFRDSPRVTVRFVRIGGKRVDSDNLVGGFKAVRDQLARWLLVDDGSDRLRWEWPAQEPGEKGFRIELTAAPPDRSAARHRSISPAPPDKQPRTIMAATLFGGTAPAAENDLSEGDRNALVLSCQRLCRKLAGDAARTAPTHDADDLEQEALLACVEASHRYNPAAGTKFSTYATACINRHLANVVTRSRGEGVVRLENWDSVAEPSREASPAPVLSHKQEYLLSRLTEPSRTAVKLVIAEGIEPDRAAVQMGIPVKDLKMILRNAAMDLAKESRSIGKPGLFDPVGEGDHWAQFLEFLGELWKEFFGDEQPD